MVLVAPNAALEHWLAEMLAFSGLQAVNGHVSLDEKAAFVHAVGLGAHRRPPVDVVVVTFDDIRQPSDLKRALHATRFVARVVDEAHNIKNLEAETTCVIALFKGSPDAAPAMLKWLHCWCKLGEWPVCPGSFSTLLQYARQCVSH